MMEEQELKMMSNNELKQRCDELEKEYKDLQKIINEQVQHLFDLSFEYNKITEIVNKREGKNGQ